MAAEVSYLSRFLVKFVEIVGAGFASAVSAYLLAQFGGVLMSSPAPGVVQATPTAGAAADAVRAPPPLPVAAAAVNEPQPAQEPTGARSVPPAGKVTEPALPPRAEGKTDRGAAEKRTPADKSAEALARAALAKMDADRRSPAAPPMPRPAHARAAAAIEAAPRPTEVRPQAVQPQPVGAAQPLRSPAGPPAPATPANVESGPVAAAEPLPSGAGASVETSAPKSPPATDRHRWGVLSALGRIPDLLRPDPPPMLGEAPRPPAPVGTAARDHAAMP
jgi:hypothetical protein